MGFVFTKEDLTEIRDMLLANKVKEKSAVFKINVNNMLEGKIVKECIL